MSLNQVKISSIAFLRLVTPFNIYVVHILPSWAVILIKSRSIGVSAVSVAETAIVTIWWLRRRLQGIKLN